MKKDKPHSCATSILRDSGLKVTPARVAILEAFSDPCSPQTAFTIASKITSSVNKTTIYRTLESLSSRRVLYKTNFRDGNTHYELQSKHHHHIVCTACGFKEPVSICVQSMIPSLCKKSHRFSVINDHILEFFGVCTLCLKTPSI